MENGHKFIWPLLSGKAGRTKRTILFNSTLLRYGAKLIESIIPNTSCNWTQYDSDTFTVPFIICQPLNQSSLPRNHAQNYVWNIYRFHTHRQQSGAYERICVGGHFLQFGCPPPLLKKNFFEKILISFLTMLR